MAEVFLRRYKLTVGRANKIIERTLPPTIINPVLKGTQYLPSTSRPLSPQSVFLSSSTDATGLPDGTYRDYLTIPAKSLDITDLQMTANIEYEKDSSKPSKQNGTIKIKNMSASAIQFIRAGDMVVLRAGYSQNPTLPIIFAGSIKQVYTDRTSTESITTLLCGDSVSLDKDIRVVKNYPPGTTRRKVVRDLLDIAAAAGVPTGKIIDPAGAGPYRLDQKYPRGYNVSGILMNELQKVCKGIYYKAYKSLGKLFVEPIESTDTIAVIDVTPTDLNGFIKTEHDSAGKRTKQEDNKRGIKVPLFLNGNVSIEKALRITAQTPEYKGSYQIKSVKHTLDFEGNTWQTLASCVKRD